MHILLYFPDFYDVTLTFPPLEPSLSSCKQPQPIETMIWRHQGEKKVRVTPLQRLGTVFRLSVRRDSVWLLASKK